MFFSIPLKSLGFMAKMTKSAPSIASSGEAAEKQPGELNGEASGFVDRNLSTIHIVRNKYLLEVKYKLSV